MTIEIADRLIKLRKQNGLSQEELADKLGLSRQAVSKWERAEASPDTDNLICLAKLYGISLDELLKTDDDVETIVEEQVKKEEEPKQEKKEGVHVTDDGVFVTDDEGQTVEVVDGHVRFTDKDGKEVSSNMNDGFIEDNAFFVNSDPALWLSSRTITGESLLMIPISDGGRPSSLL